jgi:2-aminoethylphosphonate-pyruvate transaminase
MKAVILAAGMGTRLREHHQLPKGFLVIDEKPIIQESIQILRMHGIQEILIVTGYGAEHYEQLTVYDKRITTVKNDIYAESGSLYSLYCARDWIDSDFLLLESDIVYEACAIPLLCAAPKDNVILVSGATHSNDEIYVEAQHRRLINMSKDKTQLISRDVLGEFVGINKISLNAYRQLINLIEPEQTILRSGNYEEDGLVRLAQQTPINCLLIQDLLWGEIDNIEHLTRVKQLYHYMRNTI